MYYIDLVNIYGNYIENHSVNPHPTIVFGVDSFADASKITSEVSFKNKINKLHLS